MRKIIIVGTVHGGATPENELKEILEIYAPDQLFVEIAEEDVEKNKLKDYPPEMIFVYKWARQNSIKVNGFDSKIDVLAAGKTDKDNKKIIAEQKKRIKNLTWKDMNKEDNVKMLYTASFKKLIDFKKEQKRELEMLNNIKRKIISKGIIVIVTGCGHLNFFEKKIRGAVFPFR